MSDHPNVTTPWEPSDAQLAEIEHDAACCNSELLADRLYAECDGQRAYAGSHWGRDESILRRDPARAGSIETPELLALAIGLSADPRVRLAALDEIARRIGVPQY